MKFKERSATSLPSEKRRSECPLVSEAFPVGDEVFLLCCFAQFYGEIGLKGYAEISCKIIFSKNSQRIDCAKQHSRNTPLRDAATTALVKKLLFDFSCSVTITHTLGRICLTN